MKTEVLLQPENHNKKYEALFLEIDQGRIKIPLFQREFVWAKEQSAKLVDSILKGYPVGTFIFWKTREELRSYKDIGNCELPRTPKGDYAEYVLDGQQRITSLYAIRKGVRITKDGREIDYKDIFVDLDYKEGVDDEIVVFDRSPDRHYVSVHALLTEKMGVFYKTLTPEQADLVQEYNGRLTRYDFSCITIKEYPIDIATEVFSRINTSGKTLTVFEIMVAKTYDEGRDFDLVEKFEMLRDGGDDVEGDTCLRTAKFETTPEVVAIQSVGALSGKKIRSRDILRLRRALFIDNWEPMKAALFSAVDFVRHELRIPVSQLLPYHGMLVPLTYFFHAIGNTKTTRTQRKLLEQWFYWTAYNARYSSGAEAKIVDDLGRMEGLVREEVPAYKSDEIRIEAEEMVDWTFSTSDAQCKMVLCLFAYNEPKTFDSNGIVNLDNSNLKIASSRNYHHFFPKAFLAKTGAGQRPNLMANITLVDGYSNKYRIRDRAPSVYISKFEKENEEMDATLKSHLIGNRADFGIDDDDYDTFITMRSREIVRQLNRKLDPFKTRAQQS
jgi:hypothetical protein